MAGERARRKKKALPAYMEGVKRKNKEGKRLRLERLRGVAATGVVSSQKAPSGGDVPAPGAYDDIEFKLMETGKMISKDEHTFVGRMIEMKKQDCPPAPGDYTLPKPPELPLFSKMTNRDTPLFMELMLKETSWKRGVGDYDIAANDTMRKGPRISLANMTHARKGEDLSTRKTYIDPLIYYEESNGTGPATFNLQSSQNHKADISTRGDGRFVSHTSHAKGSYLDRLTDLARELPGPTDYDNSGPDEGVEGGIIPEHDGVNWLGRIVETNQWKLGPGHNTVPGTLNGQGAKMSNEERKTLPLGENRHVPGPGAYAVGGSSIDSSKGTVFNPQDGKTVEEHILEQAAQVPGPGQYDAEENPAVRGGHFRIFMDPNWLDEKIASAESVPGVGAYDIDKQKMDRGITFLKKEGGSFVDAFNAKADDPGPTDTAIGTVGIHPINRGATGIFISRSSDSVFDGLEKNAEDPGPGQYHPERHVTTFKPRLLGDRTVELIRSASALQIYDRGELVGKAGDLTGAAKMGGQQKHSQSNHMTNLLRANTAHGKITDRDYTLQYRHRMHQWKNRGDSTTGPEKMFNFGASSLPKRIGATGRLRPEGVRSTPAITVGGVVRRATRLDTLAETAMQMQGDAAANTYRSHRNPLIKPPRQDVGAAWQSLDTYKDIQTGQHFTLDDGEYIEAKHAVPSLRTGYSFTDNRGFRNVDEDIGRVRGFVSELLASDGITARQT